MPWYDIRLVHQQYIFEVLYAYLPICKKQLIQHMSIAKYISQYTLESPSMTLRLHYVHVPTKVILML